MTSNISRSGMLVQFADLIVPNFLPKVGDHARILIDLPANTEFPPRSLECSARVVRMEGMEGGSPTAAFEIHSMKIRDRDGQDASSEQLGEDLIQ